MTPKQRAAEAALDFVRSGTVVGLGSGSTADLFIDALGAALTSGRFRDVAGVPTSVASERRARGLGIPIVPLHTHRPAVTVDGADEIDPNLDLIKGLGGALLREKVVAQNSGTMVVIADAGKVVTTLGEKHPLPVEVAQFAHEAHADHIRSLGGTPVLRVRDGRPVVTDNGNVLYDARFPAIRDPGGLDARLRARAGVVETGLFVGLATVALIADGERVRTVRRAG